MRRRSLDDTAGMSTDEELEYSDSDSDSDSEDDISFRPLNNAIENDNIELVESLILRGEDLNEIDWNSNLTPLTEAIMEQNVDIVKLLLKHGADINKKDGDENFPIEMAEAVENTEIIEELEVRQKLENEIIANYLDSLDQYGGRKYRRRSSRKTQKKPKRKTQKRRYRYFYY